MYKSTDTNAPTLSGISLINLLNTCLVTGYPTVSVVSLTQTGNIATATIASNSTLVTGNYLKIAGTDQSDYNGTFQVTVVNSTTFTYTLANNPVSPATGTIFYSKAGLGWTQPFNLDPWTVSWDPALDPYYSNEVLLLHGDGTNGSTTFTDSGPSPKTATPSGNAQISTAQSKVGGASMSFDGSGDYLTIPTSTDFDLGNIYTIEFWIKPTSLGGGVLHRGFYTSGTSTWAGLAFSIRFVSNNLRCYFYGTTTATEQYIDAPGIVVNGWTHVAMVRNGTVGTVYVNGVLAGTLTGLNTCAVSSQTLRIGEWDFSAAVEYLNGYLDDIRITKGVARYVSNFTPGISIGTYRSANMSTNQFYLRIVETGASAGGLKEVVATGFETMTDASTGTGQFPTSAQNGNNGVIWTKSITADSTVRAWTLIGDDKTFYLLMANGTRTTAFGFGHLITVKPGDGYNTFIGGQNTANSSLPGELTFSGQSSFSSPSVGGVYLARSYSQFGVSVPAFNTSYNSTKPPYQPWNMSDGPYGNVGPPCPSPVDFGYIFLQIFMGETSAGVLRGRLPGWYHLWSVGSGYLSMNTPFANYDEITSISNMPNAKLVNLTCEQYQPNGYHGGKIFIDFVGPWV